MRARILTAIFTTALMTATLFAQKDTRPVKPGAPGPVGRCMEIVQLTEGQKQQARTILEAAAPVMRQLNEQLKNDQEALRAALSAAQPEACAVGGAMLKVESTQKAIGAENEKVGVAIQAILTPEQKLRFSGCMDALHEGPKGPRDSKP